MNNITIVFKKTKKHLIWKRCPVCHGKFPEYLMGGVDSIVWKKYRGVGGGMRKTICPNCGSGDRDRVVFLYLRDTYLPKHRQRLKVLHIAPEKCVSEYLCKQPNIEYIAGDKRCEGYGYSDCVQDIDVMNLNTVDDNSFDLIICNHVLEHVENDIVAMQGFFRILKPSGTAILQVPYALKLRETFEDPTITSPEARIEAYGQRDHVRLYGMDYPERLKQVGFDVEVLNIARKYSNKAGLNRNENLFVCHKL